MERWPMQRIVHRDERVTSTATVFPPSDVLRSRKSCRSCAATRREDRIWPRCDHADQLADADIVVAPTDRISFVRAALQARFQPKIELLTNRSPVRHDRGRSIASRSPFAATSTVHSSLTITATPGA